MISLWAGILGAIGVFAGVASGAPPSSSCSTHGLAVSSVRVVRLQVQGVPCSRARTVAGTIAHDLAHGETVSVSGAQGLAMSEESCTGCKTTTSVSISYPSGKVTVSLRGGSGSSAGSFGGGGGLPPSSGSGTVV
jgi:hypothetical protein